MTIQHESQYNSGRAVKRVHIEKATKSSQHMAVTFQVLLQKFFNYES